MDKKFVRFFFSPRKKKKRHALNLKYLLLRMFLLSLVWSGGGGCSESAVTLVAGVRYESNPIPQHNYFMTRE